MTIDTFGVKIGHAAFHDQHTGCTVFLLPPGAVASADPRGPAPGTRELALLQPDKPIASVHALLLTGGSAFGLAAADGVMRYLAEHEIGHVTPLRKIPLVPTAVVYDLFFSGGSRTPNAGLGYEACLYAHVDNAQQGNVGVGAGVTVGKWGGFPGFMKGGFGLAAASHGALRVFAAAAVNAVGDIVDADGQILAGAEKPQGGWRAADNRFRLAPQQPEAYSLENTTLVVVATNARLDKISTYRLAQRAHDGMAQAIRPIHTSHDGDTAFALATGAVDAPFDWVANIAADLVAEAIRNAARHAHSVGACRGLAGKPH